MRVDLLERHGALNVTAEVHDLFANGRDERMRDVLLGEVVAADSEDKRRCLGRLGDAEDRAGEELAVRLGRCPTLQLARSSGESLPSSDTDPDLVDSRRQKLSRVSSGHT